VERLPSIATIYGTNDMESSCCKGFVIEGTSDLDAIHVSIVVEPCVISKNIVMEQLLLATVKTAEHRFAWIACNILEREISGELQDS